MNNNRFTLSNNLRNRPHDEHFADMTEFLKSAKDSKDKSMESIVSTDNLEIALEDDKLGLKFKNNDDVFFEFSRYSLEKLNRILGYDLSLIGKLSANTVLKSLQELWEDRERMRKNTNLLTRYRENDNPVIRDIREDKYKTAWDYDYYSMINEFLPNGMKPASASINIKLGQKPALFRGDRNSICFFRTENDNGGNANLGGLKSGLLVWNSEVQERSIGFEELIFRDLCSNFIIWGATSNTKKRKYHTAGNVDYADFYRDTKRYLMELDGRLNPQLTEMMEKAMTIPFTKNNGKYNQETKDEAIEKLRAIFKQSMSKKFAERVVEASQLPQNGPQTGDPELSFWTVMNGLTWEGKNTNFASDIEDSARMAGQLLTLSTKA